MSEKKCRRQSYYYMQVTIPALLLLLVLPAAAHAATITIYPDSDVRDCEQRQSCLNPDTVTVLAGENVIWYNPSDHAHSITSGIPESPTGMFDTGIIMPGYSAGYAITAIGSHPYYCTIHPWMQGTVRVTSAPVDVQDPPLHQYKAGAHPENVKCSAGMHLAYRTSDASPICIRESSMTKMLERGIAIPEDMDSNTLRDILVHDMDTFTRAISDYVPHGSGVTETSDDKDVAFHAHMAQYKAEISDMIRGSYEFRATGMNDFGMWDDMSDDWVMTESEGSFGLDSPAPAPPAGKIGNIVSGSPPPPGNMANREYSQTNIQVAGVDEPDFVKNDADSIYVIGQNDNVVPVSVDEAGRLFSGGISPYITGASHLLLHKNMLAVVSDHDFTTVTFIDVASEPRFVSKVRIDTEFYDARMIGDIIYVITISDIDETPVLHFMPGDIYDEPYRVSFFNDNLATDSLYTITAIPIYDNKRAESASFVMGKSDIIYVSENNAYITYAEDAMIHPALFKDGVFFEYVISEVMERYDLAQMYVSYADGDVSSMARLAFESFDDEHVPGLESMLADRGIILKQAYDGIPDTAIQKISLDGTDMAYEATGRVSGEVQDSFALDQYGDNLRAVTSTVISGMVQSNVYTLDVNLDVIGSLEGVAPGETLHSARFSEDWLYMVTFRQVDPFFVIDVSEPEPEVLGVLKIPGYSEYLQKYDSGHVVGIGRDTNQNMFDDTEDAGIKMSMFDVTDFENPREVDSVIIGDRHTDSASLVEHKSILIDKDTQIISMPIRFGGELFFYVYAVDDGYKFHEHSKVPHQLDEDRPHHVRSLYIGDVLYTITPKLIKANDLLLRDVSIDRFDLD